MRLDPFIALAAVLLAAAPAFASQGDDRGRKIAKRVSDSDSGYGDEVVSGVLTIRASDGTTAERRFTMSTLERNPGGDMRVVVFEAPRDLAGFVSLTHSGIIEPDQQWIFLPQLNRTRRLSARDRTGAFAGSEFSYEDIGRWELEKYDYTYVREAPCGAVKPCEVIINLPLYEYSGYSKLVELVDMDILQPRKIVYHDRAGNAFKQLEFQEYEQFGPYWRPRRMVMTNTVTGAVSKIDWSPYRFRTGLSEADFRVERIEAWAR